MGEEINAMLRTNTWSLVPPNTSMNVVGCRWVFRLKRDSSGHVARRRARLVAKGVQLVMLVYVDDILVTGNQQGAVDMFIQALSSRFVTRDLGDLHFFLGIEAIKQADGSLLLYQR